jgi:hypothetical protein
MYGGAVFISDVAEDDDGKAGRAQYDEPIMHRSILTLRVPPALTLRRMSYVARPRSQSVRPHRRLSACVWRIIR